MARAKQSQESSQERRSIGGREGYELIRLKMRAQDLFASRVREVVHLANRRPPPRGHYESTVRVTCDQP